MSDETRPVCRRCGESIARAGTGRPPAYCSRNCRQRDYELRRARRELLGLLNEAEQRDKEQEAQDARGAAPSFVTDESSSVTDETPSGAPARPVPPPPVVRGSRRRLGMTANPMPLWEE